MTPPSVEGSAPLPSLGGLRWLAACAVFGFHLLAIPGLVGNSRLGATLQAAFQWGKPGMSFFFVLSGFILTWSARPSERARAFWRRRMARVFPSHLVVWLSVLIALTAAGRTESAGVAASGAALMQAWIPNASYFFGGNTPAWSLSCEIAFYLAFPFLLTILRRLPARGLRMAALGVIILTFLIPIMSDALPTEVRFWAVAICPLPRLLDFVLGMLLARIVMFSQWRGPGIAVSGVLVIAFYAAIPVVPTPWAWSAWMQIPFALLIAAAVRADLTGGASWLRTPVLLRLGELSFAFYLVHQPVIRMLSKVLTPAAPTIAVVVGVVGALMVGLLAAWLLRRFVEVPARRWLQPRPAVRRPAGLDAKRFGIATASGASATGELAKNPAA